MNVKRYRNANIIAHIECAIRCSNAWTDDNNEFCGKGRNGKKISFQNSQNGKLKRKKAIREFCPLNTNEWISSYCCYGWPAPMWQLFEFCFELRRKLFWGWKASAVFLHGDTAIIGCCSFDRGQSSANLPIKIVPC